jgi:hypothetical protein
VTLQVVDLCSQQCNLNFGRTAVVFATTKLRNDFALASTLRDILELQKLKERKGADL